MIYDNFLILCNECGKTPSAVALEMGLSKTSVNRWKKGGGVTDATALKIANYFGITVDELKNSIKKEPSAPKSEELDKNDAVWNWRDSMLDRFPDVSLHDVGMLMSAVEGSNLTIQELIDVAQMFKQMSPDDRKFVRGVVEAYRKAK